MTLESRHLVGVFLGVVVLCGVFFTLGYVMGKSQPDANVMAASPDAITPTASGAAADAASKPADAKAAVPSAAEWSFPSAAEPSKPAEKLEVAKPSVALNPPAGTTRPPAIGSAPVNTSKPKATAVPRIAKGSIVLQIAALTRESDALLLADALQRKGFPSYVATPGSDKYYRVQVGPYADTESADLAKAGLKREGFKAIVKR